MRSPRLSLPVLAGIAVVVAVAVVHAGEIRERAAAGLSHGMPPREAALARGFVLGEDEGVDERTAEDFRRAGLSHLLAVSGENVTLLALLALPLLGALRIPLRERLVWVLGLIAVYVPLAGAGPSIQRAAVMGAAGLLATLAGRRGSRLYALGLALLVTLAIDPGVAADVGWQLSFAAVLGILLLASPLREAIAARLGTGRWRRALAEGVAVTVSATLATAPLIAYRFETVSTTTLVANVLVLPAVAPAMWLGMVSAAAAQLPGLPVRALNGLDSLLLAYIAQVAAWCAAPSWAELRVHLNPAGLLAAYGAVLGACVLWLRLARWRRLAAARRGVPPGVAEGLPALAGGPNPGGSHFGRYVSQTTATHRRRVLSASKMAGGALLIALALWWWVPGGGSAVAGPRRGLRIEVLDVGQGDSILLQPARAPAVLVDGGPPGDDLVSKLRGAGVGRLGAVLATHDQADHVGGIEELLGRMPVARLLYGRLGRGLLREAAADRVPAVRLGAGRVVRSGSLRLETLWPPPELLGGPPPPGSDPNQLAVVVLVRWHSFSMLLTADAEAGSVPIDPGPVDVLKVAHHGSEDAGLATLLARTRPRLAVISVGAANPYGHPTAPTLRTLAAHHVPILRTDRDGTVTIEVGRHGFRVGSAG
ncbi:MAG TPA: ComEC/Rec2 family competence protein [Solirubrobacterales bacterium]|nr:ComEC/Rec2 family competence protein [Solirubrobacterales bacterium]